MCTTRMLRYINHCEIKIMVFALEILTLIFKCVVSAPRSMLATFCSPPSTCLEITHCIVFLKYKLGVFIFVFRQSVIWPVFKYKCYTCQPYHLLTVASYLPRWTSIFLLKLLYLINVSTSLLTVVSIWHAVETRRSNKNHTVVVHICDGEEKVKITSFVMS